MGFRFTARGVTGTQSLVRLAPMRPQLSRGSDIIPYTKQERYVKLQSTAPILLVSPLVAPIMLADMILYITPLKELRP